MEPATQGIKLFGAFINNHPQPPERQQPITGFKLFGVVIRNVVPVEIEADQKPSPQAAKKTKKPRLAPPHRQELPMEYRDLIASRGADVDGSLTLVLSRRLTSTDMNSHHNRLSMPQGQIKHNFLTPAEEALIQQSRVVGKRNRRNGIEVTVVDPSKRERSMTLARWNAPNNGGEKPKEKSWWYALIQDWMKLARDNALQEGDAVQVWSFRFKADGRLGFIVHKVQPPPAADHHNRKKRKVEFPNP